MDKHYRGACPSISSMNTDVSSVYTQMGPIIKRHELCSTKLHHEEEERRHPNHFPIYTELVRL